MSRDPFGPRWGDAKMSFHQADRIEREAPSSRAIAHHHQHIIRRHHTLPCASPPVPQEPSGRPCSRLTVLEPYDGEHLSPGTDHLGDDRSTYQAADCVHLPNARRRARHHGTLAPWPILKAPTAHRGTFVSTSSSPSGCACRRSWSGAQRQPSSAARSEPLPGGCRPQ